jgi:hypothetical protein
MEKEGEPPRAVLRMAPEREPVPVPVPVPVPAWEREPAPDWEKAQALSRLRVLEEKQPGLVPLGFVVRMEKEALARVSLQKREGSPLRVVPLGAFGVGW